MVWGYEYSRVTRQGGRGMGEDAGETRAGRANDRNTGEDGPQRLHHMC